MIATRSLAPDDAPAIAAMVRRCTNETLYWRLLGGLDPVHAIVDPIQQGRPSRRIDIGAFAGPVLIGVASLVPSQGGWEAAMLVEDAWQRNGIGSRLAQNLAQRATRTDIGTLRVTYGGENRRAARLVTCWAHDEAQLSVSNGVIERLITPRLEPSHGAAGNHT